MKSFFNLKKGIIKKKALSFLVFSLFIFSLFRIPSLIEPYWYGDEGIYGVIGMAIRQGRILYQGIWDNKPPFLYLVYALANGDLFSVRLLSMVAGMWAIIAFFFLARVLFQTKKAQYITIFLFAISFGLPFLEGNIANAENFILAPIITAFYLLLRTKKSQKMPLVIAGFLFSCAFLFKIVALFDFLAAVLILLVLRFDEGKIFFSGSKKIKGSRVIPMGFFKDELLIVVSFLIPIIVTLLYFALQGALSDLFRAVFTQNIGYVDYGNKFIIPQGLLFVKIVLLGGAICMITRLRKLFSKPVIVIFLWLAFSLFNALFSQRPYTHYLLVLLPSVCLLVGLIAEKSRVQILSLIIFVAVILLITRTFGFYSKIIPYYINYTQFIFNNKSVNDYQAFFDKNTPRDYELASFITAHTSLHDSIFLWSDSGQIYVLSKKLPPGRYAVAYHITSWGGVGLQETKNDVIRSKPKYIIDTKHSSEIGQFLSGYALKYQIASADIYERQF